MKNFFRIASLLILVSMIACKDDKETSKQDVQTKMLVASPWGNAQVTHSDGDLSDQYTSFAIMFTDNEADGFDGTFVISNGGNAFSESAGNWKYNDDLTKIILDSGKEMDFTLTETALQLDFTVATPGGRAAGLSGHFIFDLLPL